MQQTLGTGSPFRKGHLISRSIFSNYLGSVFGLFISKGLRFIGLVLCIRLVGNHTWGLATSTLAIFSFLTFFIDQGLGGSPLLFHLHNNAVDKKLLFLISTYRSVMAVLFIVLMYLVHFFIHPLDRLLLIYAFVLVPRALGIDWWFLRRELYQVTLYIASVRTLMFFLLVVLLIRPGSSAETVIYIEMFSEGISVIFGYALMKRLDVATDTKSILPDIGIRELLVFSFPFLIIGVLNTVQTSMDIVLIRFFRGSETVAQYDVGTKIGFLYFFLGATIVQIIKPKLTRLYLGNDTKRIGLILKTTSGFLLLLGSFFLLPSLYFPAEIIGFFFKKNQELTIFAFRWAALWVGMSFMTMLCADTLLSVGLRRKYVQGAWICALANIISNVILLKFFSGYGAIFAKVISELAFMACSLFWLPFEIRREIFASLLFQFLVLFAFFGVYFLSVAFGHKLMWFSISVAGFLAIAGFGKIFTRETLLVLKEN